MKKIILYFLTILILSCTSTNAKKEVSTNKDSTILALTQNKIQGDSSFLYFFNTFVVDAKFQKSRIIYPILYKGKEIKTNKDWNYLPFYSKSEYIPTLASDTVTVLDKTTDSKLMNIFILDFENSKAENYAFEKINFNWYLKNCENTVFKNLPDYEFIEFLIQFSKDSNFQVKNIKFPLQEAFVDFENNYKRETKIIKITDWKYWQLTKHINQLLLLSNIQIQNNYRNIFLRGIDNGIWAKYTFEKINGNWKLIKLEDYST